MQVTDKRYIAFDSCGWIYQAISLAKAEQQVREFNAWFNAQSENIRSNYTGPASIISYEKRHKCSATISAATRGSNRRGASDEGSCTYVPQHTP